MRDPGTIREVSMLHPDFMGFIFYPGSRRYVGENPGHLVENVTAGVKKVAVFVNEETRTILRLAGSCGLTHVQLHGNETPDECRQLSSSGLFVIKAFRISTVSDLHGVNSYNDSCDYYLFDSQGAGWGGSGKQFDWALLQDFESSLPFFLSGGIGPEDVGALRKLDHKQLFGVDVNSSFETAPGMKNTAVLERFIKELR